MAKISLDAVKHRCLCVSRHEKIICLTFVYKFAIGSAWLWWLIIYLKYSLNWKFIQLLLFQATWCSRNVTPNMKHPFFWRYFPLLICWIAETFKSLFFHKHKSPCTSPVRWNYFWLNLCPLTLMVKVAHIHMDTIWKERVRVSVASRHSFIWWILKCKTTWHERDRSIKNGKPATSCPSAAPRGRWFRCWLFSTFPFHLNVTREK